MVRFDCPPSASCSKDRPVNCVTSTGVNSLLRYGRVDPKRPFSGIQTMLRPAVAIVPRRVGRPQTQSPTAWCLRAAAITPAGQNGASESTSGTSTSRTNGLKIIRPSVVNMIARNRDLGDFCGSRKPPSSTNRPLIHKLRCALRSNRPCDYDFAAPVTPSWSLRVIKIPSQHGHSTSYPLTRDENAEGCGKVVIALNASGAR